MNIQDLMHNQSCRTTSASHVYYDMLTFCTHIALEGEAPIDGTTSGTVAVEKSAVNSVEGTDTIQAEGAGETEAEAEAEVEGVVEDPMAAEMNEEVEEKIEESTPSASKDVLEQLQTDSEVIIPAFIIDDIGSMRVLELCFCIHIMICSYTWFSYSCR